MDNENDHIHECQCDGPGQCPVYNVYMNKDRYEKCKHDASWRKHYSKFFAAVNSEEMEKKTHNIMEKKVGELVAMQEKIKQIQIEERNELRSKYKAYLKQEQQAIEDNFVKSLSSEEKETFTELKTTMTQKRKESIEAEQQLDKVVAKIEEEGINLDNYKENKEGLGDVISGVLSKLGITSESMDKWSGLKGGCGCSKRQKFLNKILPFSKKE